MRTYVVWCPDLGQRQEDGATIPATDPAWWMTPPAVIVFECESRIQPEVMP